MKQKTLGNIHKYDLRCCGAPIQLNLVDGGKQNEATR